MGPWWSVTYGDQRAYPDKPWLRNPEKVLAGVAKKLIAKHDKASQKAVTTSDLISKVVVKLQPKDPNKWGSQ